MMGPWIRCGLAAVVVVALGGWEPFRTADPDVSAGNTAYAEGRYDDALAAYDRAGRRGGVDPAGLAFDRGTAELKKAEAVKDPAEKRRLTERALEDLKQAQRSKDPKVRAPASYNRGNALMAQDKLEEAIEAYKDALRDDSALDDARLNLELALRRRQQKKQQQGQGQGGQSGQKGQDQGPQGQGQGQGQDQGQGQGQGSNQQTDPNGQGSNQPSTGANGQGPRQPPNSGGNGQGSNPPQNGTNGQGSNAPTGPRPNGRPQRNRTQSRLPKTPNDTKLDDLDESSRRLQRDDARRRATGRASDPQHDW
jgi:hypothetical protein